MIGWRHERTFDLSRDRLMGSRIAVAHNDKHANEWIVNLKYDGEDLDLTGYGAVLSIIRPDQTTIAETATIDGSVVSVSFPLSAYTIVGSAKCAITISDGDDSNRVTVDLLRIDILATATDEIAPEENLVYVSGGSLPTESQTIVGAIGEIYDGKQDKLTAGRNITIVNNVISASGGGGGGGETVYWDDIEDKPSTFPPDTHTHTQNDISGLSDSLNSKASATHTHTEADVTGLTESLNAKQDQLIAGANITIASDGRTISATGGGSGGSTAWSDITGKPSTFPPSSHVHEMIDVNGLSDALSGKSDTDHTHTQSDVTGLSDALSGKANSTHTHSQTDVDGLSAALSGKANATHTHDQSDVNGLSDALSGKANATHDHTMSNITGLFDALSGKQNKLTAGSNVTISEDGTISAEVNDVSWEAISDKPSTFTPSMHSHAISDVSGLSDRFDYSETEIAVGKWLDGRTIYRRTYKVRSITDGSSMQYYWLPATNANYSLDWSAADSTTSHALNGYNSNWIVIGFEGSYNSLDGRTFFIPTNIGSYNELWVTPNGNFAFLNYGGLREYVNIYLTVTYVKAS